MMTSGALFVLVLTAVQLGILNAAEEDEIRLVDGGSCNEGIAQIFRNGEWGNICDQGFVLNGWPSVLCLELGFSGASEAVYAVDRDPSYSSSNPNTFESPACSPDESKSNYAASMADCGQDTNPTCDNSQDVWVTCTVSDEGTEDQVRLTDGPNCNEGIAQIYRGGQWGNICDQGFVLNGWPSVLCLELGFSGASEAVYAVDRDPSYSSSNPINFESPACSPDESKSNYAASMADCGQDTNPTCDNTQDVYVTCAN